MGLMPSIPSQVPVLCVLQRLELSSTSQCRVWSTWHKGGSRARGGQAFPFGFLCKHDFSLLFTRHAARPCLNLAVDLLCTAPSLLVLSLDWSISPCCSVALTTAPALNCAAYFLMSLLPASLWGCGVHINLTAYSPLQTQWAQRALQHCCYWELAGYGWVKEVRLCGRETQATSSSCSANRVKAREGCSAHEKGCRLIGRLCGLCRQHFSIQHADRVHIPPACSRRAGRS